MQSPFDALIRRLPRASFCNLPHVPRMKLRAHVRIVRDGREGREGEGDYSNARRLLRGVSLRIRSVFSHETRFGISDETESLLSRGVQ